MQLLLKRDEIKKLANFSETIAPILALFAPKDAAFQALHFDIKIILKQVIVFYLFVKVRTHYLKDQRSRFQ